MFCHWDRVIILKPTTGVNNVKTINNKRGLWLQVFQKVERNMYRGARRRTFIFEIAKEFLKEFEICDFGAFFGETKSIIYSSYKIRVNFRCRTEIYETESKTNSAASSIQLSNNHGRLLKVQPIKMSLTYGDFPYTYIFFIAFIGGNGYVNDVMKR